jgi:hypothetical protein
MNSLIKKNDYVALVQQGDGNFRVTMFPRLAYDIYTIIHPYLVAKDKSSPIKSFLDTWIIINDLGDAKELYKMYSRLGDLIRKQAEEEDKLQSIRDIQNVHFLLKNKILSQSMTDMIHDDIPAGHFLIDRNKIIAGTVKTKSGMVFTKDDVLGHESPHQEDKERQRFSSEIRMIPSTKSIKDDDLIVRTIRSSYPGFNYAISAEKVSYFDKELFAVDSQIKKSISRGQYTEEQHNKMLFLVIKLLEKTQVDNEDNFATKILGWLELQYRDPMFYDIQEDENVEAALLSGDPNNVEGSRRAEELWERNEDQGWLLSDVSQTDREKLEDALEEVVYYDGLAPEQQEKYEWSQSNAQVEWRMQNPDKYTEFLREIWNSVDDSLKTSIHIT